MAADGAVFTEISHSDNIGPRTWYQWLLRETGWGFMVTFSHEMVFVLLFQCEKCELPITVWLRTPQQGKDTEDTILEKDITLRCVAECGWSGTRKGSEAKRLWSGPWSYRVDS